MQTITLRQPDDWHVHLRDGEALGMTVPDSARCFGRISVMPNLTPPVHAPSDAAAYLKRIEGRIPEGSQLTPLLSLYLNAESQPDWARVVREEAHLLAFKYYPQGATTHSEAGVRNAEAIFPILEAMQAHDVPLQMHGEVTHAEVDIFDREKRFLDEVLSPILHHFPKLRVVLEHITTLDAVAFVRAHAGRMAATITPHHLLLNRNDLLVGGIKPHHYCLPVLKRRSHQKALIEAATSGEPCFFLGSDSAPHTRAQKESACGCAGIYSANACIEWYATVFNETGHLDRLENFASRYGAEFYQLPLNTGSITLSQEAWSIPESLPMGNDACIPLGAGEACTWKLV